MNVSLLLRRLETLYPNADCTLRWNTPLELLVATILSAQCTDTRVNQVTVSLFLKYQTAKDFASASRRELEKDIHSCGTFRMKAKAIQEACTMIVQDFSGDVPRTMHELLQLRGVGRKTASVVLSTAFDLHEGIAVDTHVFRVSRRLGLTTQKTPEGIEKDLMKLFDRKDWGRVSHLLIFHGRAVCKARGHACRCREMLDVL